MTLTDIGPTATSADHLIEYPAGSGRMYHRHEDGSVLRVEAKLGGTWQDLTCDVAEVSITWGDTSGNNLTPTGEAGQADIRLKDMDGRYGPLPPAGRPLFSRWCPVRVWVGYVSDPDHPPTDLTTRYGVPGTYGGTPPAVYGGTARIAQADGIACRFSGWVMSQTRTPESTEAVTAWSCGDGMVRLVDQEIPDYNGVETDAEWPTGLRENAPGNYRVGQLVSFVQGPTGQGYSVVSTGAPTSTMMQSPGGKVGDLVTKIAESDLAFFWWQPDVVPTDHDTPADWFGYQTYDWLASHGIEWPVQCDGVHGFGGVLVSSDSNFYSDVRAAKGMTKRTLWSPQPPWTGFAFDSSVAKVIGSASFKVQPGESYSFKSQLDLNCDKVSIEYWVRIIGTDLVKLGENTLNRDPNIATVTTSASSKIVIADDTAPDTVVEVQIRGRSLGLVTDPGYLATNVWFILERGSGKGPEVVVDDPTLADEAEIHEYAKTDLMLRQQADVTTWATWIVERSSTNRWTMESVSTDPGLGTAAWSWGAWHSMWLGDRAFLEIPDGDELHVESQWIRGLEFRIADTLTLTMHLESVHGAGRRALRVSVPQPVITEPSIPIPGGRIVPNYEARPELPGWNFRQAGQGLMISTDGSLEWSGAVSDVTWPIRTAPPPAARVELNKTWPREIRFYEEGPSVEFEPTADLSHVSGRIRSNAGRLELDGAPRINPFTGITFQSDLTMDFYVGWLEAYTVLPHTGSPTYAGRYLDGTFLGYVEEGADDAEAWFFAAGYGPGSTVAGMESGFRGSDSDATELLYGRIYVNNHDVTEALELRVTTDTVLIARLPEQEDQPPAGGVGSGLNMLTPFGSVVPLVSSTGADPLTSLYGRQIGVTAVSFAAGVGTITVPEEMGATRVAHCQIVGTTVGGPMVAQVSSPTTTSIVCYLSTAVTGTLDVAWTIDYEAVPVVVVARTAADHSDEIRARRERRAGHAESRP